jgi:hypothetical protein
MDAIAARRTDPDEEALDAVIEKIDRVLPLIHARVSDIRSGRTPTSGFKLSNIRRTKAVFEGIADDSLLTDSKEDIRLKRDTDVDEAVRSRPHESRIIRLWRRAR